MISVQNLTKYYDTNCAVDNISFDIEKGEVLGLLGPNGAGKTTTMRIMTCYLHPTAGSIKVKDFDINEDPREVKALIGYLPESAPLYPDMITQEYLDFVAGVRGVSPAKRQERIDELTDLCGLEEVMHKSIKEVSRGYKQRVGLAHAMMSDPEVLILDEPTAGLDPNQIVEIRSIIKRMGRKKTVVLSTHILSEAEATCDRIVIVDRGKIVADGTPDTLSSQGLKSQVLRLVFSDAGTTELEKTLAAVPGVKQVVVENGEVRVFCDGDLRGEVYAAIKKGDWTLLEFTMERQSLEDTFRELTLGTEQEGGK